MSDFFIAPQKRQRLSADELALIILRILQRNSDPKAAREAHVGYFPLSIESVVAFEICAPDTPPDAEMRRKTQEATQVLYSKGFVMRDPDQSGDTFVLLTGKGRSAATDQTLVGVTDTRTFISAVEAK